MDEARRELLIAEGFLPLSAHDGSDQMFGLQREEWAQRKDEIRELVYRLRHSSSPVGGHQAITDEAADQLARLGGCDEASPSSLIVESLDPNCLMLLIEGEAGCEVEMLHDAPKYLGTVRLYRNRNGVPMVEVSEMDAPSSMVVVSLASVKKITVL